MNYKNGLKKVLKETTLAAGGGTFGTAADIGNQGGNVGNVDFYAPGDARIPFAFGAQKTRKRKKKKKKSKNEQLEYPHMYRRTFIETLTEEKETILDGVICCSSNEHRDLAIKILDEQYIQFAIEDDNLFIEGTDKEIQGAIDHLYDVIGEQNFTKHYYCLLGEFDYSASLKQPKRQPEEYNQAQLKKGAAIEAEHTNDLNMARTIAQHHLDEDEFYYDKLEQMDPHHNQPERRPKRPVRVQRQFPQKPGLQLP